MHYIAISVGHLKPWGPSSDVHKTFQAETETRPETQRSKTETLGILFETKPRRDVGTSRDCLETETTSLGPRPWTSWPVP